jgi:hypothetical protein
MEKSHSVMSVTPMAASPAWYALPLPPSFVT